MQDYHSDKLLATIHPQTDFHTYLAHVFYLCKMIVGQVFVAKSLFATTVQYTDYFTEYTF